MTTRFLPQQPLRIAYVVNNAAFFVSHRLPIALAARGKGCEVMLFTGQAGSPMLESQAILDLQAAQVAHRAVSFGSAGVNLVTESVGFLQLIHRLWRFKPDIVHCASPKGILYGGLAARLIRAKGLVLAVSGMGYLFTGTSSGWKALARRCYQSLVKLAYRHPNKFGIVQNGPNCTLGDFSLGRVQRVIDQTLPIYKQNGLDTFTPDLKPAQVVTNKFIDPAIHLKTRACP